METNTYGLLNAIWFTGLAIAVVLLVAKIIFMPTRTSRELTDKWEGKQ